MSAEQHAYLDLVVANWRPGGRRIAGDLPFGVTATMAIVAAARPVKDNDTRQALSHTYRYLTWALATEPELDGTDPAGLVTVERLAAYRTDTTVLGLVGYSSKSSALMYLRKMLAPGLLAQRATRVPDPEPTGRPDPQPKGGPRATKSVMAVTGDAEVLGLTEQLTLPGAGTEPAPLLDLTGQSAVMVHALSFYWPGTLPSAWEARFGPLVRSAVVQSGPGSAGAATARMRACAYLAVWATAPPRLLPLRMDTVFAPEVVAGFVKHVATNLGEPTAATYRGLLTKVGAAVLGDADWDGLPGYGRTEAAMPYSRRQLEVISAWATTGRTWSKKDAGEFRRHRRAVEALCVGAGLNGVGAALVRTGDVVRDDRGLWVATGGRRTFVLPEWETRLEQLVTETTAASHELLCGAQGRQAGRVHSLLARASHACGFTVTSRRMRNTWLAHMLCANHLSFVELLEAAGLTNTHVVSDLLPHLHLVQPGPFVRAA